MNVYLNSSDRHYLRETLAEHEGEEDDGWYESLQKIVYALDRGRPLIIHVDAREDYIVE